MTRTFIKDLFYRFHHGDRKLFVRFIAVGVLNTIFGYSLFALLIFVGLHYALAALVGQVLGVLFNFKTTGRLVFGSRDNSLLLRFLGVYSFTYVVNVFALKGLKGLGWNMYLAGAAMLLPMAIIAFLLNKRLVFMAKK
ncbi:MAG TPA: polysaccharide biosynthesis protein GtrA [Elusimicrobia bacterium]|nr:MAG: polysaccharide biosynthesis protein GtrA [Elusimicrobia bacterium GWF2_62_30]HBA61365.1 polysaccharide biosynthesis protein GtrA [Elusimicrobiota bacterium]